MTTDHRLHSAGSARPVNGDFVLYWMQSTMRAHDNFALNFAIEQANQLNLPVQVYHGLRHDYPWASDRFHTWILESVVDLYADFEAKGVNYAFWLDFAKGEFTRWPAGSRGGPAQGPGRGPGAGARPALPGAFSPGSDWSPLVSLARRAALVVTDYSPTFIFPRQLRGLRARIAAPVIAVDSATVVPMGYHDKEHSTARGIRPRLLEAVPHYLWPVANPEPRVRRTVELPFEPVVPKGGPDGQGGQGGDRAPLGSASARPGREGVGGQGGHGGQGGQGGRDGRDGRDGRSIAELVAQCDVDHMIPPSTTFRGGTRAGRARLAEFLETGLPRYDDLRSDPNEPDAVSRLSPWLHFGNLSIHEVLLAAREAGPAEQYARFQDEALTWRELAHNFCHFNPTHRTPAAFPAWATRELRDHESDPRPHRYTLADMEAARTGEELWNAAQRSYLREGWMHNYMRMLWGKTVLQWTRNATEALSVLEHLNNRYALDGRDPNTYGGIMWIFGKFDRPFYRRPIYGTVRYMSLKAAAGKFDVKRYIATQGSEK